MYDNKLNSNGIYYLSKDLRQDDIYVMYNKEDIIYWLDNIL